MDENIKPIRSPEDHARALEEIEALWNEAVPGTAAGDRFEVLSVLVDDYEREHFPIPAPDPIAAIRFRMEQLNMKDRDLAAILKTRSRASEILKRKRPLNLAMIRRVYETMAIPPHVLIKSYALRKPKMRTERSKQGRRATRA